MMCEGRSQPYFSGEFFLICSWAPHNWSSVGLKGGSSFFLILWLIINTEPLWSSSSQQQLSVHLQHVSIFVCSDGGRHRGGGHPCHPGTSGFCITKLSREDQVPQTTGGTWGENLNLIVLLLILLSFSECRTDASPSVVPADSADHDQLDGLDVWVGHDSTCRYSGDFQWGFRLGTSKCESPEPVSK